MVGYTLSLGLSDTYDIPTPDTEINGDVCYYTLTVVVDDSVSFLDPVSSSLSIPKRLMYIQVKYRGYVFTGGSAVNGRSRKRWTNHSFVESYCPRVLFRQSH